MNHQDWNKVVFNKKYDENKKHFEVSKMQRLQSEVEILNHEKVGGALAKRIRNARIANGYKTQKELATAINVKVDVLNSYESGKAIPNTDILQKLRRVLKTKL